MPVNGILFPRIPQSRGDDRLSPARITPRCGPASSSRLQDNCTSGTWVPGASWRHAKDYVRMQWLMLQRDTPDDYCIATGVQYSVRDFVNAACSEVGMELDWQGEGVNEKGIDRKTGQVLVEVDPRYFRPTEVETLLGDPSKAKEKLGWVPEITFDEMVAEMVREDIKIAERDELCRREGFKTFDYNE
ncbi:GDP-mannose 4,6-dehydratase [Thiohalobacter thiocyanaticus]|uniref:GDP-mannose 4,6-dehydratase n=1 Tax=Thiohalobacter thiocyanaticus TaxID=585455 RepID=A0A426QIN8_9GAMM|nr:GDP-mannose 4,6-dehydratase [Thiohalobacter thiocyanaticus]RRQ21634.1 hypothetical protein D6C00_06525 [Thiohalobacter thiocyanaticus]